MKEILWHVLPIIKKLKLFNHLRVGRNSTSRYLDDLLNIDNPYFDGMVGRICPPEKQLNKANASDAEAPFLDVHLCISNGFVVSKIYDKRNEFDFAIVNFPFWMGTFPVLPLAMLTFLNLFDLLECLVMWLTSMHVMKFQLINFSVRAIGIISFEKLYSKYYRRHYELVSKFKVGLKSLLQQSLSEPEFYGDLVY